MNSTMRGYNGNLVLARNEVRIERGLKGLLVRKTRSPDRRFPCAGMREIWFQPSSGRWGWPGYVHLIDELAAPSDDFVARVRDERAVTFLKGEDKWRAFAAAIAERCAVPLREFPPEQRRSREVVGSMREGDRDLRL